MYLDSISPVQASVGYGSVGTGGDLGYETRRVRVYDREFDHALSTHAPAQLTYDLGGRYSSFRCRVAINDDVPAGWGYADFYVSADGRLVAAAPYVTAGAAPRELAADVSRAQRIELAVRTTRWDYAHAGWLEPRLARAGGGAAGAPAIVNCLGRAESAPAAVTPAERVIATVVSPGFEDFLDDMLGSLAANGGCPTARLVVFGVGADAARAAVAAQSGAPLVHCNPLSHFVMSIKPTLYSVARVVKPRQYLCLDADMLVTGGLSPIFAALDALPPQALLVCRDRSREGMHTLRDAFGALYDGGDADAELLGITAGEAAFPLVANDGLFAGSRAAMLALDETIRAMPAARQWVASTMWVWWRNQFIFNLALARMRAGVELDPSYNVQLHNCDAAFDTTKRRVAAAHDGCAARVLHFNGNAKQKHAEMRGRYARVARPLLGPAPPDNYAHFLTALRAWAGAHGLDALAGSFYGTSDGGSARIADAPVLPLFAALHYLIRSNGCRRTA